MSSLRVDKATGLDDISARLLKEACPEIVPSLTHIINVSIRCGYFPDQWKMSKVLPLYKEDIKSSLILTTIDLYLFYQLSVK